MLAPPTAIYALGPSLTRKYVDMTFFRVESVASFQLQQYLYMEYLYRSLYDILKLWLPSLLHQYRTTAKHVVMTQGLLLDKLTTNISHFCVISKIRSSPHSWFITAIS